MVVERIGEAEFESTKRAKRLKFKNGMFFFTITPNQGLGENMCLALTWFYLFILNHNLCPMPVNTIQSHQRCFWIQSFVEPDQSRGSLAHGRIGHRSILWVHSELFQGTHFHTGHPVPVAVLSKPQDRPERIDHVAMYSTKQRATANVQFVDHDA